LDPNNKKELKLNLGKSSLAFPRNKKGHEPKIWTQFFKFELFGTYSSSSILLFCWAFKSSSTLMDLESRTCTQVQAQDFFYFSLGWSFKDFTLKLKNLLASSFLEIFPMSLKTQLVPSITENPKMETCEVNTTNAFYFIIINFPFVWGSQHYPFCRVHLTLISNPSTRPSR
jgi:hypothetical protein